jgi:hypothetical protein
MTGRGIATMSSQHTTSGTVRTDVVVTGIFAGTVGFGFFRTACLLLVV